jgi:hypothetical protein
MNSVATTILDHLGGHKFLVMTGAKDLVGGEADLIMRLPARISPTISHFRVTYDKRSDTYIAAALKWNRRGRAYKTIASTNDVFAHTLAGTFERMTGVRTNLGW